MKGAIADLRAALKEAYRDVAVARGAEARMRTALVELVRAASSGDAWAHQCKKELDKAKYILEETK